MRRALRWAPSLVGAVLVVSLVGAWRARAKAPNGRYQLVGATISDTRTGLTWSLDTDTSLTTSQAKAFCTGLTAKIGGTGWRVPTIKELESLVDESLVGPAFDPIFVEAGNHWYTSSTVSAADPTTEVWYMSSDDGRPVPMATTSAFGAIRCVRP